MKDKKERLEGKIQDTVRRMKSAPLGQKEVYCIKLEKYFKDYRNLTGEDYRIQ